MDLPTLWIFALVPATIIGLAVWLPWQCVSSLEGPPRRLWFRMLGIVQLPILAGVLGGVAQAVSGTIVPGGIAIAASFLTGAAGSAILAHRAASPRSAVVAFPLLLWNALVAFAVMAVARLAWTTSIGDP